MFNWLKKLVSGSAPSTVSASEAEVSSIDPRQTLQVATVWDVVDQFLLANPQPTPFGVHALVEAGAANLLDPKELTQVCERIQEHGYQYPINPTLINELRESELLEFVRWQSQNEVDKESYANELTVKGLIEQFRMSQ